MNNTERVRWVNYFTVGLLFILCSSCGAPTADNEKGQVEPTVISEPLTLGVPESFGDLNIEGGFTFVTQRVVELDLRFAQYQNLTHISIYSELDPDTAEPAKLLERSELQNSDRYHSWLTVPSRIQALIAVIDGDMLAEQELPIDRNQRINFTFE